MVRIRVVLAASAGVAAALGVVALAPSAGRPPSHDAALYVIGDSWSAGLHADPAHTLAQDAADDLGVRSVVDAESGTGYVAAPAGTRTYAQRAAAIPAGTRATLLVIQGGSNDGGAGRTTLLRAVETTVRAARHALPGAEVVLLGPGPDPWPVTARQTAVDAVLQRAAHEQHAPYLSPLQEGWFTSGDVRTIIDASTGHPTVAGDRVLGRRVAEDLAPLLHAARAHRPAAPVGRTSASHARAHPR